MKRFSLAFLLLSVAALSGCVVYPYGRHGGHHRGYDNHAPQGSGYDRGVYRDRDGDGVSNRQDRRPRNPYRY